jgi:phosphohistidine phosphatase
VDVYLIRHADAVPQNNSGPCSDEERPLSDVGHAQAHALGEALRQKGVTLAAIVTSPLLRARQTAEGMVKGWSPAPQILPCEDLAPGSRPKRLARFLRSRDAATVGLVGHQPDLGELAGWLIGSKKAHIDLAKGGVAYISCDGEPRRGSGSLIWLVTGDWLGYSAPAK